MTRRYAALNAATAAASRAARSRAIIVLVPIGGAIAIAGWLGLAAAKLRNH